jgi:hypothetical protein
VMAGGEARGKITSSREAVLSCDPALVARRRWEGS